MCAGRRSAIVERPPIRNPSAATAEAAAPGPTRTLKLSLDKIRASPSPTVVSRENAGCAPLGGELDSAGVDNSGNSTETGKAVA
jgi:hypothetical protein